ncbi:uncharacterized protein C8A04DRAFT_13279 [Dichotomopilus funicola]|uniref:Phosphotransferase n=1 Tax=Dichotomopilus funicola TaxID=1934379 RepID=A0AAN6V013_9PEZI|nr:hypothetical protein C8A04DRAFT_13279 [Dichotomopilus funicola]
MARLDDFLQPLAIDTLTLFKLSDELASTFRALSAESLDQFLPTPISEPILRSAAGNHGRFLAIDILFSWIGGRIAEVVTNGCGTLGLLLDAELPMGVTFSFPMQQKSLSEAVLMPMGKGFAVTTNLDLAGHLMAGYEKHKSPGMPIIKIAAIANDSVATLVSFLYQFPSKPHQKAAMGLIVGTGSNATLPLKLSSLHESKRPVSISILPGQEVADVKIAVNTEWSIRGSAPPLRKLGLISQWDTELDEAGEIPGFQPLEYMTAGRYLGELARLIFLDYYGSVLKLPVSQLPRKVRERFGLSTTFLSHLYPGSPKGSILRLVEQELESEDATFSWTLELATDLSRIAKAIEVRAAGIIAASTIGLLRCADELPSSDADRTEKTTLAVGYTGGCIQHFQDYLADTQRFIDDILRHEFGTQPPVAVILTPCHDGGITGAGILVPAALGSQSTSHGAHTTLAVVMTIETPNDTQRGTMAGAEPIAAGPPRSSRRRSRNDGDDSSGSEEIDPNQLDMMLSRSVQSAVPVLEPESFQHSMLRNTRVHSRSRSRRRDATTPLLRPVSTEEGENERSSSPSCDPDDDSTDPAKSKNPYLGGVSVTHFWLLFLQINANYFIACFDSTIMASSHPVITSYFGAANSASWLSTAFLLTSTSFQPMVGGLSDALGRKPPYVISTIIFLFATVWCAAAQSMTSFIFARALCGLGAGGMLTLGSILVPLIMACLAVAILVVPNDIGLAGRKKQTLREAMRTFDFKGSFLMSSAVTSLILGLSPHMNLIFSNHIAAFLSNAILFNVPLFFQGVLLTTATTSGLRLVVSSALSSMCGTATGFLISYTRRLKWPLVSGTALTMIGTFCLASMQRGWPTFLYILCLLPSAAGSGFQFPGTFMAILSVSEQREQAVVTGTLMLWRSLGQVLGVACSSLVVQNALWYYLEEFVTGPEKEDVVARVRKSVEVIRELPLKYQGSVVQSYEAALRVTFLFCAVLATVSFFLIVPVRLPRLGKR